MGLRGDCRCVYCKTALTVSLLMQLPQSMFGIRSNAVVLLKQQIAYRPGMSFLWGHKWVFHTKSDVLFISSFNGGFFKGPKMLSSFPFTPSKQRHWGYTEHAEDSTHLYQEKGFVDLTFIRSRSPSCLMSSYLLGCVFFIRLLLVVWRVALLCIGYPRPLRLWGPRLWLLHVPRIAHNYQQMGPSCHNVAHTP